MTSQAVAAAHLDRGRRRFAAEFAMTAGAQFAVAGGRTVFFLIVARFVGPSALGDVTAVIALGTLLGLIAAAGTGPAATQQIAAALAVGDIGRASAAYRWALRLTGIALLVAGVVSGLVYGVLRHDISDAVGLSLFTIAYGGYQFQRAADYGFGFVPAYLRTELVANALTVALAPVVLFGRAFLIAPICGGYALFVFLSSRRASRTTRAVAPSRSAPLSRTVNQYALINGIGTLASMASLQLSVVVARSTLGAHQGGLYAAAFALLLPVLYLPRALGTALLPRAAADAQRSFAAARKGVLGLTWVSFAVALPLSVLGTVFASPILSVVAGSRYLGGSDALRLLFIASFFLIVGVPAVNTLAGLGLDGLWAPMWSSLAGVTVTVAVWAVGLVYHGESISVVAVGVLLGSAVKSVPPVLIAFRRFELPVAYLLIGVCGAMALAGCALEGHGFAAIGASLASLVAAAGLFYRAVPVLRTERL